MKDAWMLHRRLRSHADIVRAEMEALIAEAEVLNELGYAEEWGALQGEIDALLKDMDALVDRAAEVEGARRRETLAEMLAAMSQSSPRAVLHSKTVTADERDGYKPGALVSEVVDGEPGLYAVAGIVPKDDGTYDIFLSKMASYNAPASPPGPPAPEKEEGT